VDFGTATVFDAVTADGEYIGGALTAGLARAADALYESASQLRRVELIPPENVIGHSTVESTQSGLIYGFVSMVEGMVERFGQEMISSDAAAQGAELTVVATGGLAPLIAAHTDVFTHVNPDLTLIGLRIAYDMNA
jgi:type III pantothenate kinase